MVTAGMGALATPRAASAAAWAVRFQASARFTAASMARSVAVSNHGGAAGTGG